MKTFTEMLKEGSPEDIRKQRELRYKLAEVCMEDYKVNGTQKGRDIYSALSHLAQVPELEVNMAHYDNLLFMDDAILKPEVFYYVQSKMHELEELINAEI